MHYEGGRRNIELALRAAPPKEVALAASSKCRSITAWNSSFGFPKLMTVWSAIKNDDYAGRRAISKAAVQDSRDCLQGQPTSAVPTMAVGNEGAPRPHLASGTGGGTSQDRQR